MAERNKEARGSAERKRVESQPDWESIRSAFRFGWSVIWTLIFWPKSARDTNRDEEEVGVDQQRTGTGENREC